MRIDLENRDLADVGDERVLAKRAEPSSGPRTGARDDAETVDDRDGQKRAEHLVQEGLAELQAEKEMNDGGRNGEGREAPRDVPRRGGQRAGEHPDDARGDEHEIRR